MGPTPEQIRARLAELDADDARLSAQQTPSVTSAARVSDLTTTSFGASPPVAPPGALTLEQARTRLAALDAGDAQLDAQAQMRALGAAGVPTVNPMGMAEEGAALTPREREVRNMGDWMSSPEVNYGFSGPGVSAFLGTLAGTDVKKVLEKQLGVKVQEEQDGSFTFKSKVDGNSYAWKKGFQPTDVVRGIGQTALAGGAVASLGALGTLAAPGAAAALASSGLLGTVAGGAAAGGVGTAVLEGVKSLAGGNVSVPAIVGGTVIGGGIPILGAAARGVANRFAGVAPAAAAGVEGTVGAGVGPAVTPPPTTPPPTVPQVVTPRMDAAQAGIVAAQEREAAAATGLTNAGERVVTADAAIPAAQERQAAAGAVASSAQQEAESAAAAFAAAPPSANPEVTALTDRGREVLTDIAKNSDRSLVNKGVRDTLEGILVGSKVLVRGAIKAIEKAIGGRGREISAPGAIAAIDEMAKGHLNGIEGLPGWVQRMRRTLAGRIEKDGEEEILIPARYGDLDSFRKEIGRRMNGRGLLMDPKGDRDVAAALYGPFARDQRANIARLAPGRELTWDAAQALGVRRAELRAAAKELFNKKVGGVITGDMMPKLERGVLKLSGPESAKFISMMDSVPKDMKSDVLTAALSHSFGDIAAGEAPNLGQFGKWYKGVLSNSESKKALDSYLRPEAQQHLKDLFQVSQRVAAIAPEEAARGVLQETARRTTRVATQAAKKYDRVAEEARRATEKATTARVSLAKAGEKVADARAATFAKEAQLKQATAAAVHAEQKAAEKAAEDAAAALKDKEGMVSKTAQRVSKFVKLTKNTFNEVLESSVFKRVMDANNVPVSDRAKMLEKSINIGAFSTGAVNPLEDE